MKNKFVADGRQRFLRGKKTIQSESVGEKYAAELAKAVPEEKRKIRARVAEEFLRREKMLNCFVENFSLTPGFSRVHMVCAEKKTV
jgi:hypothetical protein